MVVGVPRRKSYSDHVREVRGGPPPAPRYLFTLTDAQGGKLYSGIPQGAVNALEVTDLDTGEKTILFTVPRRKGYAEQCLDLQARLTEVTGRRVANRKLLSEDKGV